MPDQLNKKFVDMTADTTHLFHAFSLCAFVGNSDDDEDVTCFSKLTFIHPHFCISKTFLFPFPFTVFPLH